MFINVVIQIFLLTIFFSSRYTRCLSDRGASSLSKSRDLAQIIGAGNALEPESNFEKNLQHSPKQGERPTSLLRRLNDGETIPSVPGLQSVNLANNDKNSSQNAKTKTSLSRYSNQGLDGEKLASRNGNSKRMSLGSVLGNKKVELPSNSNQLTGSSIKNLGVSSPSQHISREIANETKPNRLSAQVFDSQKPGSIRDHSKNNNLNQSVFKIDDKMGENRSVNLKIAGSKTFNESTHRQPKSVFQSPALSINKHLSSNGITGEPISLGFRKQSEVNPTKYTSTISENIVKPFIHEAVKPHLFTFIPYQPTHQSCEDVLNELTADPSQSARAISLVNLLGAIAPSAHDEPGESAKSDKDAQTALEHLYKSGIDAGTLGGYSYGEGGIGLLPFFSKIATCEAEAETGRTLYQKLVELGLVESVKSDFSFSILSQEMDGYAPHLSLDKDGNTLVHLAVMSGSASMFDLVLNRENLRHSIEGGQAIQTSFFWLVSALNHKNNNGKLPLDLAPTHGFRTYLKKTFRNITNFLSKIVSIQNLSSATFRDLTSAIHSAEAQISSSNVLHVGNSAPTI